MCESSERRREPFDPNAPSLQLSVGVARDRKTTLDPPHQAIGRYRSDASAQPEHQRPLDASQLIGQQEYAFHFGG